MDKDMDKEMKSKAVPPPDAILRLVSGFQRGRVLLTAYELDLFSCVGNGGRTASEVAAALSADARALERLMNVLCNEGLLEKKGDLFYNTPLSATYLSRESDDFMYGMMHWVNLWDSWSTLTPSVIKGRAVLDTGINDRGEEWLKAFIGAMHQRAPRQAAEVSSLLDLSGVKRVLDVGGGSGAFAMGFVTAGEGIEATVFDLPNVVPITRGYIEKEGFDDRIATLAGDYHTDSMGKGYDLIFLSAIVHMNTVEENIALVKKCADALNPGGRVAVMDFLVDESRTQPPFGAMFALNMLVATQGGDTYTESEISDWMTRAGLSDTQRLDTSFEASIVIGRKAG